LAPAQLKRWQSDSFRNLRRKANTTAVFINALRDEGRSRTKTWLDKNFRHIGARSSFTLDEHLY
jgi:hypothetical protein